MMPGHELRHFPLELSPTVRSVLTPPPGPSKLYLQVNPFAGWLMNFMQSG
jgi:hypothetical protein